VLAVALPTFVIPTAVGRATVDTSAAFDSTTGPPLLGQTDGRVWTAPNCAGAMAEDRLWKMLVDAHTFGQ
jgi:hypothetical protein